MTLILQVFLLFLQFKMQSYTHPYDEEHVVYRSIAFETEPAPAFDIPARLCPDFGFSNEIRDHSFQFNEKPVCMLFTCLPCLYTVKAPPCPTFLGKVNMVALVSLELLLSVIRQCFADLQIDYEYISDEFSFRCAGFAASNSILFNLNVYHDDSKNADVIEFQRQQGCCMLFTQFWKKIQNYLVQHQVLENKCTGMRPPCICPPANTCNVELIKSIKCLIEVRYYQI